MRLFRSLIVVAALAAIVGVRFEARAAIEVEYVTGLEQVKENLRNRGVDNGLLERIFSDERVALYPEIVGRTGKGFNYLSRRFGLLTKSSVDAGRKVLQEKGDLLKSVEAAFGVEKEIIVAVLRIETNFGRNTGSRPIFNSLLTFALIENRRSAWALGELAHLLRLCSENRIDPLVLKGSWAGAFGLPQFIPSSYVKYGVDGDGDGLVDLFTFADAAHSVANYLKANGWRCRGSAGNRRAVWAYNHCHSYVKAVFAYAAALKRSAPAALSRSVPFDRENRSSQ